MPNAQTQSQEAFLREIGLPLTTIARETWDDPLYGPLTGNLNILEVTLPKDALKRFSQAADRFVSEAKAVALRYPRQEDDESFHMANHDKAQMGAALLLMSVALNRPKDVQRIAQACPEALTEPLPCELLSLPEKFEKRQNAYTAYGAAMQLSRTECMHAMAEIMRVNNIEFNVGYRMHKGQIWGSFDISAVTHEMSPSFLPCALGLALNDYMHVNDADSCRIQLSESANSAVSRDDLNGILFKSYIPAFIASGVYDLDPDESFRHAFINGHTEIMRHFEGRVPWEKTAFGTKEWNESPFMHLLCEVKGRADGLKEPYEDAWLALVNMAMQEGRVDKVFTLHESDDTDMEGCYVVEPLNGLIEQQFNRVLLKFLENGLDPRKPPIPGAKSLFQMAKDCGNAEAGFMMKAFMARAQARQTLLEIDKEMDPDVPVRTPRSPIVR